jgi:hypothetical protein
MHEIITKIDINAPVEIVWSILLDFGSYPQWNPFIRSISGKAEAGARLKATIQLQGGKSITFRPRVLVAAPNKELRWRGRFILPGLFDGEHFFQLESVSENQTIFTQGEKFSGLLVPLLKSILDQGTKSSFISLNESLKTRAEKMQHQ